MIPYRLVWSLLLNGCVLSWDPITRKMINQVRGGEGGRGEGGREGEGGEGGREGGRGRERRKRGREEGR
jgi:hypothetical protein